MNGSSKMNLAEPLLTTEEGEEEDVLREDVDKTTESNQQEEKTIENPSTNDKNNGNIANNNTITYFGVKPATKISKYVSTKITLLQFWSIIAVVYTHSYNGYPRMMHPTSTYNPKNGVIAFQYFLVGGALRFAVPIFFMMSGFLFFMHKKYDQPAFKIGKRIDSRIKSVLIPYLLWDCIAYICVVIILLVIPKSQKLWPWHNWLVHADTYKFPQILWTIKGKIIDSPVPYPLWYLRDLFFIILQTPLFYYIHKKTLKFWIFPCIVFIPWLYDLWPLSYFNLYILDLDGYLFFPAGALLALYNVDIGRKIQFKWTLIFFVIPWLSFNIGKVIIATFEDSTGPVKILDLDAKVILYKFSLPLGVCSVWYMYDHIVDFLSSYHTDKMLTMILDGKIVKVPSITNTWHSKWLKKVTPFTLWIYCAHEPIMGYIFEIVQPFLGLCEVINVGVTDNPDPKMVQRCKHVASPFWFLIFYIVAPFIWIVSLVLLGTWIKKKLPRVFARLTGGR